MLKDLFSKLPKRGQVAIAARSVLRALPAMGASGDFTLVGEQAVRIIEAVNYILLVSLCESQRRPPFFHLEAIDAYILAVISSGAIAENRPANYGDGPFQFLDHRYQEDNATFNVARAATFTIDAARHVCDGQSPTYYAINAVVSSMVAVEHAYGWHERPIGGPLAEAAAFWDCEDLGDLAVEDSSYDDASPVGIPSAFCERALWPPHGVPKAWGKVVSAWRAALLRVALQETFTWYRAMLRGSFRDWDRISAAYWGWSEFIEGTWSQRIRKRMPGQKDGGNKVPPKVFISHSSKDHAFVDRLASDLGRAGIVAWVDEAEIKIGDRLRDKIERGIEESDFMIVILSRASTHRRWKSSHWVNVELDAAFVRDTQKWQTTVLPCRIEKCRVPTLLSGLRRAEFVGRAYEEAFAELVQAIREADA